MPAEHVSLPISTWGKCLDILLAIACRVLLFASCATSSRSGPLPDIAASARRLAALQGRAHESEGTSIV